MDQIEKLRLFIAIFDNGSLAAAGRQQGRTPSSVTKILSELEDRLGARLFQRSTRKISPTDAGLVFAEQARRLLADFDDVMNSPLAETAAPRGHLRLSAPTFFGHRYLAPILGKFLEAFPGVTAEIMLEDRLVDLIEERIDATVRIGNLGNSSFSQRQVGSVRRVIVASPDYLHRHGTPAHPADLKHHEAILFVNTANGPIWNFSIEKNRRSVQVKGRCRVNRADAAIALARSGKGLARVLSYQVADEVAAGHLITVLDDYRPSPIPIQLVFPGTRLMTPKTRHFIDFTAEYLSRLPELRQT